MKTCKKYITVVLLTAAITFTAYNVDGQSKSYKIGDRGPAGGWIFYDKGDSTDGWRYLEAASEDLGKVRWGCNCVKDEYDRYIPFDPKCDSSIPDAQGFDIGTGKSNTEAILKTCKQRNLAAKKCADYRGGGKNDWFLPSINELNMIYENLYKNGVGNFTAGYYWSSSEYNNPKQILNSGGDWALNQDFRNFNNYGWSTAKGIKRLVLPIRAF